MQKNKPNQDKKENENLFEDAAKKLQKIEKRQKQAEKYFKERENNENKLKLLESNLKKKVKNDKRVSLGLEEKTVEKVQTLLKNLTEVDTNFLNIIEKQNLVKVNEYVQTEQEDTQMLKDKLNNLEKENEKNISKKNKYKKEIEILKSEMENLKNYNDKLTKENKLLHHNIEELNNNKNNIESRLKELQKHNELLSESLKKNEKSIKEFEDLKKIMEDKLQIEKEQIELEEHNKKNALYQYKGNIMVLVYFDLVNQITQFLPSSDVNNLKLTCKLFYRTVENDIKCVKNYYRNSIISLKNKIAELNSYDLKKDYLVNDSEIESYVKSQKLPGKELKSSILKALIFLNKDVKTPLGIKPTTVNVSTPKTGNSGTVTPGGAGILGGFGSLFGGMFKGQPQPQNSPMEKKGNSSQISVIPTPKEALTNSSGSKVSSRGMSIAISSEHSVEIDKYDKFLISENLNAQNLEQYEFDYSKPDDIKNILNKFLKSNFSTEKLTAFIKEVCQGYSELLYFANKSVAEIKELELVKNALNERYRRYHKLSTQLENELNELNKKSKNNSDQENNNKNIEETLSEKYFSVLVENNKLREFSESNEKKLQMLKIKEEETASEYQSFKIIFLKEIRNLKFDLETVVKERDTLKTALIEFKNYFYAMTNNKSF